MDVGPWRRFVKTRPEDLDRSDGTHFGKEHAEALLLGRFGEVANVKVGGLSREADGPFSEHQSAEGHKKTWRTDQEVSLVVRPSFLLPRSVYRDGSTCRG